MIGVVLPLAMEINFCEECLGVEICLESKVMICSTKINYPCVINNRCKSI